MTRQIDTYAETIISLDKAAQHISKITGSKKNRRVLLRWANRGVAGVRLPTIQVGGELFTSCESLNWHCNEVRAAKARKHSQATSEGIRTSKSVDREAQALGI